MNWKKSNPCLLNRFFRREMFGIFDFLDKDQDEDSQRTDCRHDSKCEIPGEIVDVIFAAVPKNYDQHADDAV